MLNSKMMNTVDLSRDSELEARIWIAYYKAIASKKPEDWSAFSSLVKQRSPEYIASMEKAQGIA